ncbi:MULTISPECIES: sugar transferase [Burkholderia]|uniref:Transmembrane sugar transferase n=1 Tax=Burkholderia paludis TaxID=1506587 RepID=A0A6J5D0M1_9BURK|nr:MULTISPECIES: sugar transferase [Burkholderia]CAB3746206.1 UDP-N-acetylgalactosamine-undecaprenyl-phosphate N-acetylgalactosaminephosphotransferase [Burkholderia paludis]VWB23729.1 transmembrane sugar transferase [Burkholderia paludis]
MTLDPHLAVVSPRRAALALRVARLAWRWHACRYACVKRVIDIAVASSALVMLGPLFAVVAICVRLEDRGPVLFWQRRVGRHGREFAFPKFRSMVVDAERRRTEIGHLNQHGAAGVTFKRADDPRITRIGRFIRRTSIDELPQLWCVLTGDMTLVGPRPPLPREVARYTPSDRGRLLVTPGLTCIWQVSGRANIAFPEQVTMDLAYIRERSLALDLKLLCKTVPAVLRGHGAY